MALDARFPAGMTHFLLKLLIKLFNSGFKSVMRFYLTVTKRCLIDWQEFYP